MNNPNNINLILDHGLSRNIRHIDYHYILTAIRKCRRITKLIRNGYKIKNIRFLYGLKLDSGSKPKAYQSYVFITLSRDKYELLTVFIDIVNMKVIEVVNVKKSCY